MTLAPACRSMPQPLGGRSSIVVVGASLAGLHAVRTLRREGFDGRLTIVGAEPDLPYDRPPLSKQLIRGEWDAGRLALPCDEELATAEWRLGTRAEELDLGRRRIRLDDGSELGFDGLVIATGCHARTLDGGARGGVHTLRTLDDAEALAADLRAAPGRVVVVGGGFIGTEIAAACRAMNLEVTVLEALEAPLARILGSEVGSRLAALHRENGVDIRTGTGLTGIRGGERVEEVRLSDGTRLRADVVVVAIGVEPAVGWLRGSGLQVDDGVLCDETCTAAPGVVAAGDVARWPNRRFDEIRRVEHWDNAIRQAEHAARSLLGQEAPTPYAPVPWVWSDQYEAKLQLVGSPVDHDEVRIFGEGERWLALYRRGDRLTAAFGVNRTGPVMRLRGAIEAGVEWRAAVADAAVRT